MRTIGVTGYKGRLGSYLTSYFSQFFPLDCDVTKLDDVKACLRGSAVDAVLHLAAKSDVDWCEVRENSASVSSINLGGTFNVLAAADELGMPVTLMSSDHVFSGGLGKYREGDKRNPVNQYGRSKMAAEALQEAFSNLHIIRTSYFFDIDRILSQGSGAYPAFISRSFIHIHHLALLIEHYFSMMSTPRILHLSGSKVCSWYDFMKVANKELELGWDIEPRWKDDGRILAPRPKKGGLNVSLSEAIKFPQFSYLDGINYIKVNG